MLLIGLGYEAADLIRPFRDMFATLIGQEPAPMAGTPTISILKSALQPLNT